MRLSGCLHVSQAQQFFGLQAAQRLRQGRPKTVAWLQAYGHILCEEVVV